jgi:hypothetical protein
MTPKSQVVKLSAIEMIEVMNSRQVYSENGIKRQSIATCTPQQN